jgi:cell division protease FtsH
MSTSVGPLAVIPRDGSAGPLYPGAAEVSQHTQQLIDEEVRRIVEQSHRRVVELLESNRGKLDSLAKALLEHETLDEDDAYSAAGVERAQAQDGPKAREVAAATAARVSS